MTIWFIVKCARQLLSAGCHLRFPSRIPARPVPACRQLSEYPQTWRRWPRWSETARYLCLCRSDRILSAESACWPPQLTQKQDLSHVVQVKVLSRNDPTLATVQGSACLAWREEVSSRDSTRRSRRDNKSYRECSMSQGRLGIWESSSQHALHWVLGSLSREWFVVGASSTPEKDSWVQWRWVAVQFCFGQVVFNGNLFWKGRRTAKYFSILVQLACYSGLHSYLPLAKSDEQL